MPTPAPRPHQFFCSPALPRPQLSRGLHAAERRSDLSVPNWTQASDEKVLSRGGWRHHPPEQTNLRREEAEGAIGVSCSTTAAAIDPGGMMDRPGVVSRVLALVEGLARG